MKIITVLGARPQFIKAAAVSRVFKDFDGIDEKIIHTGQHFDNNMSDIFFEEMSIPKPDYFLDINKLSHGKMTGKMLGGIEEVLLEEKPDLVMIYGDTNSTIAGALAAKKLHIKVAHVEAGLRSFNNAMPEEINRILTDRISDFLFCPTDQAIGNLKQEGFDHYDCTIVKNGDVMNDAALYYSQFSQEKSNIIEREGLTNNDFVLATIHRQENTDSIDNLQELITALNAINEDKKVVLPLHPRTKNIMQREGLSFNFKTIEPVGYFDMIELLKNCAMVLTDSGGLQKEAFYFQKHGIILRDQTEWTELIEGDYAELTGANHDKVMNAFDKLKTRQSDFSKNLYGGGNASKVIATSLIENMN